MSEKHKVENATVVDPAILRLTRDTLGQFVKRPPLTEKLLNKPPFRFLHDIMTAVISSTGFMKGLFLDAELDSENVKDKEAKVAFLQKAIDMVSLVTGHSVRAKPNKIVAGQEPEKTNEFLQALAEAINKKADNSHYVSKVLAAEAKRKNLSAKVNKPTSPRKTSSVKEPKTEVGAAMQEENTVKSETKSDTPKTQKQDEITVKSEIKSDKAKPQGQEDTTIKSGTKSDTPRTQKLAGNSVKPEPKSDRPKPLRREENTVKSETKSDKSKPQRQESSTTKSETKSDSPRTPRLEGNTPRSDTKGEKHRSLRQEGKTVKSDTKSDKPRPQRQESNTVKSEIKSERPRPQKQEDHAVKSETNSDKPSPLSHKREIKGSESEVKTDKKEVRRDRPVTKTDKPENISRDKSEGKSDQLKSRREKRVVKTDKQDSNTDKQMTRSDRESNSGKLKQITENAKVEPVKEKPQSGFVKNDAIMKQAEVKEPKIDGQTPVLASLLEVKDNESSKLEGDSKKHIRVIADSKTGAVSDMTDSKPLNESHTTDSSLNQESKLNANHDRIKVLPIAKSVDNSRQNANQVTGENQEAETELPTTVHKVDAIVSKPEVAGNDFRVTEGKASNVSSEKQTGGKASDFSKEKLTGGKESNFNGEKQEAKKISRGAGHVTKYSLNEHPKSKLTQDDRSTDSGKSEGVSVRQENATDKQRLLRAPRNDELKRDAYNAFKTNKSSSSLTSKLDFLLHERDLPVSKRLDSFEPKREVKLQDMIPAVPSVNSRKPNDCGPLLLNPAERNDLRLHEHQSAQEFWDGRRERKSRRDKSKSEKSMDVKSEKRKGSVSTKQDVRPDKLGPKPDLHEMNAVKESRTEKAAAAVKSQKSPPKLEGEKTEESQKNMVSQKVTTAFNAAEKEKFEDEHQRPQIDNEPDVDVIIDRKDQKGYEDEDDEAEFLVRADPASVYLPRSSFDLSDEFNEHGGLVKKILKTKMDLEALVSSQKATVEIDRSELSGGDISKRRQRALLLKDVSKLRSTIQALTGNVIPLVKIMDFLQEDLDCMKKEMEEWKDEIQANTLALQQEQRLLESAIEPLQIQLLELEKQIEEQEEMNAALKSQALQNEERIKKIINTAAHV